MAQIINNSAGGPNSRGNGSGVVQRRTSFGSITVCGAANEVAYLDTEGLYLKGVANQGLFAQVTSGACSIGVTLAPADLAVNPNQTSGIWGPTDDTFAVTDGVKKLTHPLASALRITFGSAGGIVHIAGA